MRSAFDIRHFLPVYLASFFFALHVALPLYVNSSFLGRFLPEGAVGMVYAASSLITIALLFNLPRALSRFGNYKTFLCIAAAQALLLALLALPLGAFAALPVFMSVQTFALLGVFSLDVFLERYSHDKTTGITRGILLTIVNLAIFFGPIATGIVLSNGDFWKIYLLSALSVLGTWAIVALRLKDFKDPVYRVIPYLKTFKEILFTGHPNDEVKHAIIASFFLRFFYSWMVIYTPIYLNTYMGFPWTEIGWILGIMLLPFVLFQIPAGYLSDTAFGEKKILIAGFSVMSFFTAALFFVTEPSFLVWAALLFATRIGASFVEVASESYFFKHIESGDTSILSVYRNSEPIAYVVAPLAASLVLGVLSMAYLFPALAVILLLGIVNALRMRPVR